MFLHFVEQYVALGNVCRQCGSNCVSFLCLGMLLVEMFSNLCVGTIYEQFTEGVVLGYWFVIA